MRCFIAFLMIMTVSVSGWADYTLAVFGDSLSAGYRLKKEDSFYMQLERGLQGRGYDIAVLNTSKSGETTEGGLRRVNGVLPRKPNGVILELGVNDSLRNSPIPKIKKNLQSLIDTFQKKGIPILLVGMKTIPNKPADYQQQFENMYRELATDNGLILYPFFMDGLFWGDTRDLKQQNDYLLANDIHPNGKGVSVMVRGILPTVERFLNQQGIFPKRQ